MVENLVDFGWRCDREIEPGPSFRKSTRNWLADRAISRERAQMRAWLVPSQAWSELIELVDWVIFSRFCRLQIPSANDTQLSLHVTRLACDGHAFLFNWLMTGGWWWSQLPNRLWWLGDRVKVLIMTRGLGLVLPSRVGRSINNCGRPPLAVRHPLFSLTR